MARTKSVSGEAREVGHAIELIRLGARLQVLESEIALPRERLLRLYKEVAGTSPAGGMLPFSTEWFTSWQPNIHSSLFYNLHSRLAKIAGLSRVEVLIRAYRLYVEQTSAAGCPQTLTITRAWRLLAFVEAGMLDAVACRECSGRFVVHKYEPASAFVCGLCQTHPGAGRVRTPTLDIRG